MQFRLLGPLEIESADQELSLRKGRPRALLLALLLEVNHTVPAEVLIDRLWSDSVPKDPGNALQLLVSYLRRTLGEPPEAEVRIVTDSSGYRLVAPVDTIDLHQFSTLVTRAVQARSAAEKLRFSESALRLWRGDPLAEVRYESWAEPEVSRLEELHLLALEEETDALVQLGREKEAVPQLQSVVAHHPTRERSVQQLMLALYRTGRQAHALEAYENLRASLADELGVDPGPAVQRLHLELLQQAPGLSPRRVEDEREDDEETGGARALDGRRPGPPRLPVPLTRLLGREHELQRLERLLADRRLLTVTGPGGAGKSRLVAELAVQLASRDQLLGWADLAAVRDAEGATAAIVAAAGLSPHPGDDPFAPGLLAGWNGVLVLDTCEHLVAELRPLVRQMLEAAADVRVLSTSRRPLGVPGELTWPLSALSLPDPAAPLEAILESPAVQLFVERAEAVQPEFAVTGENCQAVAQLCLMLDGLPLALELAAAQLVAVSPGKLVELLADRFRVLVGDDERRDALRATVDWSYALLDAEEALLFEVLSVFAGSFSLEAAAAVAGPAVQRDPFQVLLALVRHSLVTPVPGDRFRLLDTLREYAADRLVEHHDEADAARGRHLAWYTALAQEADSHLRGPDLARSLEQLRADLPNLRAALDWSLAGGDVSRGVRLAASMSWFWSFDGLFAEAYRYLSTASQLVEPGSTQEADVLAATGVQLSSLGRLEQAAEVSRRAAEIFQAHRADVLEARALTFVGISCWALRRFPESTAALDRAVDLFHRSQDLWGEGLGRLLRARTTADGTGDDVRADVERALALLRRSGDQHLVGLALEQQARGELRAGHPQEAAALATQACQLLERVGYAEGAIAAQNALGLALTAARDSAQAEQVHTRALRLALDLHHPGSIAEAVEGMALSAAESDPYRALTLLAAAETVRADAAVHRLPTQESVANTVRSRAENQLDLATRQAAERSGSDLDLTLLTRASSTKD